MSLEIIALIVLAVVVLAVIGGVVFKKKPRKLKTDHFQGQWKELQKLLRSKENWQQAVLQADQMLDKALKLRRYKGKTMGERMVSAQRTFSNNDAVWFAHNLCKKLLAEPDMKLKEKEVKSALIGFRQALRDIGALQNGETRNS